MSEQKRYLLTCLDFMDGTIYSVGQVVATGSEDAVRTYYENRNREVLACNKGTTRSDLNDFCGENFIEEREKEMYYKVEEMMCVGVPDFVVFDSVGEWWMFVEVKHTGDGLRRSQLDWMKIHSEDVPVKVMYTQEF